MRIQALGLLALNGHLSGFIHGSLATWPAKGICVPALNCYSCPGAIGACPIGSLQAVSGAGRSPISLYVIGLMVLFGLACGRLFCGYLCPFGFFQDLLYKCPGPKLRVPQGLHRLLSKIKYLVLIFPVILLPILAMDAYGNKSPIFCARICPQGTLQAGLPLASVDPALRASLGTSFAWKLFVLIFISFLAIVIGRVFCRYICPLGAFFGLFNRISIYRIKFDPIACTSCKQCARACPVQVDPSLDPNQADCIRCHQCVETCPEGALSAPGMKKIMSEEYFLEESHGP